MTLKLFGSVLVGLMVLAAMRAADFNGKFDDLPVSRFWVTDDGRVGREDALLKMEDPATGGGGYHGASATLYPAGEMLAFASLDEVRAIQGLIFVSAQAAQPALTEPDYYANYVIDRANPYRFNAGTWYRVHLKSGERNPRLLNISTRATVTPDQPMIAGTVVKGGPLRVLVRAVGPGLSSFGVNGVLADPVLRVFDAAGNEIAMNDNWGGTSELVAAAAEVAAFPLDPASRDAALTVTLPAGAGATFMVTGGQGVALVEVYRLWGGRFANVSTRAYVGTGTARMIAGFVVEGVASEAPQRNLLVRAVGPELAAFGIGGLLADPRFEVFAGSKLRYANDNRPATLRRREGEVAAFPINSSETRSAGVEVFLSPGSHTVVVEGVGETTGVAIVEAYEFLRN